MVFLELQAFSGGTAKELARSETFRIQWCHKESHPSRSSRDRPFSWLVVSAVLSGGPAVLSDGPALLSGGPGVLSGGPAVLSGGPGVLSGGPAILSSGPAVLSAS